MQGHSEIGERILAKVDDYGEIAHDRQASPRAGRRPRLSRWTNRRRDPAAVPNHRRRRCLQRDDIAIRPYREAMPSRVARMRLAQAVGTQFDTTVVAAFEAILATADERTG